MHQGQPVPSLTQPPARYRVKDAIPADGDEPARLPATPVPARPTRKVPGGSFSWLGHLHITANAARCVPVTEMLDAFARHAAGDWGAMDAHDRKQNDRALITRGRLLSMHTTRAGQAFRIITDPGWRDTTLLLPEDY